MTTDIKNFLQTHKRFLSPVALFAGFVFDTITLTRIDLLYDNFVLFSYLFIAATGIVFIRLYKNKVFDGIFIQKIAPWLPLLIQFAFGGLFSGYFVFYTRSASLSASWFFMLLLFFLLVGNEFFRKWYEQFVFQMSIFYLSVFSFSIFFIPVMVGKIGASMFLISGAVSLCVVGLFYVFFAYSIPDDIDKHGKTLIRSIFGIYIFINILYFANIIPPIPLSLKDIGVYYSVERTKYGNYDVAIENKKWNVFDGLFDTTIYRVPESSVYVYSSVFAPTGLDTNIAHLWEYYDATQHTWITTDEIGFPIYGGRGEGYRGFSFKKNVSPGKWRVSVVTLRGQLIGRESFVVVDTHNLPELSINTLE